MKSITIGRLASLDILRGFDMFWIVGGRYLIISIAVATDWDWLQPIVVQMKHSKWAGFHFYDLIFPLFMFISGVVIPYSLNSKMENGVARKVLFKKVIKRGLIMFLLGIIYNGTLQNGFSTIRVTGVLAQIGLAYLFAATIFLYARSFKWRIAWLAGILVFIAVLQLVVPVPGYGAGLLDPVGGINAWLDRRLLPGRLLQGTYDSEGLLCIVSAITVTLMGTFAGSILRDGNPASRRKAGILLITGAILVILALVLSTFYPIIKKAWTVPYNLLTAGISFALLSMFYFVIDVKKWTENIGFKELAFFFKVIGMNSLTIYLAVRILDFIQLSNFFFGWIATPMGNNFLIPGAIAIEWLLLYYLYKKKIFIRI